MRWIWLLAVVAVAAVATVWSAGTDTESVTPAQATTSSVVVDTTFALPAPFPFPIPPPDIPLPPGFAPPAAPPGGDEVLNIHSPVVSFTPGQTVWSASGEVAVSVRTDKPAPKVGEAVTFEVTVATAGRACCRVVLRPGGDASFDGGGGLTCLPDTAAGTTTATFRWTHVYERSGRFLLSVVARSGTCSEAPGTGGLSSVIEVF